MKTLVLSMISIAATIAAMTACTSESDPINEITNPKDAKVEIKATAGIGSIDVETKAAINPNASLTDVAFVRIDQETPTWTTLNEIECTGDIAENTGVISFKKPQYYPQIGAANFISYYPNGKPNLGVISYTDLDGTKDIMCSDVVVANRTDIKTANFALKHKLTQFKFKVRAEKDEAISNWGTITSLTLINQKNNAELSLNTRELTFTGEGTNSITIISDATTALKTTTDGDEIGSAILVEAGQSSYKVQVVTSNQTVPAEITLTVDGTESTAYTILLTFKGKNIESEGSIGAWTESSGSGEIE